jgi:hypothetical protein
VLVQNIVMALGIKAALVLTLIGLGTMWMRCLQTSGQVCWWSATG